MSRDQKDQRQGSGNHPAERAGMRGSLTELRWPVTNSAEVIPVRLARDGRGEGCPASVAESHAGRDTAGASGALQH